MDPRFTRLQMLVGAAAMERLQNARVAVFGLGGVGGYVVEGLARAGIGALDLIDDDKVNLSNFNRQILATEDTLGMDKADAAAQRVLSIHPAIRVTVHKTFFLPDTAEEFDFTIYDYVADAIDTVTGKLELVRRCKAVGTPIISAMGTGNRLDPSGLRVMDLSHTSGDPLARILRKELRRRGIEHLKVVCSADLPLTPLPVSDAPVEEGPHNTRRSTPGSSPFVPPVAGLIMAAEIVRDLLST